MLLSKDIEWLKEYKTRPVYNAAYKILTSDLKMQTESRGWKKVIHANGNQKKAGVIFHRTRTNNFKICMETQKTLNSQNNLEKEESSRSFWTSDYTTKL